MSNKKIGSKLAESVRHRRSLTPGETARSEATPAPSTRPAPLAADEPMQRAVQEPPASHGILHPSRIWPD